jgi:outer membrane protein assembly factor BamB
VTGINHDSAEAPGRTMDRSHRNRNAMARLPHSSARRRALVSLWLALLVPASGLASAQQWPQWRGPARDGVAQATPPAQWPAALTKKWEAPAGGGHATPVVADGRVFVHARTGEQETITALDAATGTRLWHDAYAAPYKVNPAAASHGPGPKATPVVADGRLYTFGISGILSCLDAASGKVHWRKQPSPEQPDFGVATSPIVVDGMVVVFVGGPERGALAAFDALSGAARWRWSGGAPAYASPVLATLAGTRQLVTQSRNQVVGVGLDGTLLWQIPLTTPYDQNSVTPVIAGDLVIYSGLSNPTTAVRIVKAGSTYRADEVWKNADVSMYMSTAVVAGDALVGLGQKNRGQFFAIDWKTGRTLWTTRGRETDNAALIRIPGHTLIQTTEGELIVARDSHTAFEVVERYDVAESSTWAHPALAGNQLVVRDATSVTLWSIG